MDSMEPKKERVQFDFAPEQLGAVDALKQKTGAATRAEVVRKALAIYDTLLALGKPSDMVEIRDRTGELSYKVPLRLLIGALGWDAD